MKPKKESEMILGGAARVFGTQQKPVKDDTKGIGKTYVNTKYNQSDKVTRKNYVIKRYGEQGKTLKKGSVLRKRLKQEKEVSQGFNHERLQRADLRNNEKTSSYHGKKFKLRKKALVILDGKENIQNLDKGVYRFSSNKQAFRIHTSCKSLIYKNKPVDIIRSYKLPRISFNQHGNLKYLSKPKDGPNKNTRYVANNIQISKRYVSKTTVNRQVGQRYISAIAHSNLKDIRHISRQEEKTVKDPSNLNSADINPINNSRYSRLHTVRAINGTSQNLKNIKFSHEKPFSKSVIFRKNSLTNNTKEPLSETVKYMDGSQFYKEDKFRQEFRNTSENKIISTTDDKYKSLIRDNSKVIISEVPDSKSSNISDIFSKPKNVALTKIISEKNDFSDMVNGSSIYQIIKLPTDTEKLQSASKKIIEVPKIKFKDTVRKDSLQNIINDSKDSPSYTNNAVTEVIQSKVFNYREDDENLGMQTISKTAKFAVNSKRYAGITKYTTKAAFKTGKTISKGIRSSSSVIYRLGKSVITKVGQLAVSAVGLKAILVICLIALSIAMLFSMMNASAVGALSYTVPLSNKETLLKIQEDLKEIDIEYNERTHEILRELKEMLNEDGTLMFDEVIFETEDSDATSAHTDIREVISILTVDFKQDINDYIRDDIKNIQSVYYERLFKEEIFHCEPGCKSREIESEEKDEYGDPVSTRTEYYCDVDHLRITVTFRTHPLDEVLTKIEFTEPQKDWTYSILNSDWSFMYPNLDFSQPEGSYDRITPERLAEILENAPTAEGIRDDILQTAYSLLGQVQYRWGAKASAGGQPTYLDCSGFVDWVYKTAGIGDMLSGGGTSYQWSQSYPIPEDELKPGDLVFKQPPQMTTDSNANHVGIYIGKDESGNNLYIHCASGSGVVINSWSGFEYYRRVAVNFLD